MSTTYKTKISGVTYEIRYEPSPMQGFRLSVHSNYTPLNDSETLHLGADLYWTAYSILSEHFGEEKAFYILFKAGIQEPEYDYELDD